MKVSVRLFANLREYAPDGTGDFEMDLAVGAPLKTIFETLAIPDQVQTVALVNGRRADPDTRLNPGDSITLFPPMEGG
jgi:molybdopterin converting factor small subunit